jgi:hypothetical protein
MTITTKPRRLRYCFDTEFVDGPEPFAIDFFSIGIAPENFNGPSYYGVSNAFNEAAAIQHVPWLQDNVIAKLPPMSARKSPDVIRDDILKYLRPAKTLELWAKNGAYDQFALCKLFGTMNDFNRELKKAGIEQVIFRDINELVRAAGFPQLPKEPEASAHIAVKDAEWDRYLFRLLSVRIQKNAPQVYRALGLDQ